MLISSLISLSIVFLLEWNISIDFMRTFLLSLFPVSLDGRRVLVSNLFLGAFASSAIALIGFWPDYYKEKKELQIEIKNFYSNKLMKCIKILGDEDIATIKTINNYGEIDRAINLAEKYANLIGRKKFKVDGNYEEMLKIVVSVYGYYFYRLDNFLKMERYDKAIEEDISDAIIRFNIHAPDDYISLNCSHLERAEWEYLRAENSIKVYEEWIDECKLIDEKLRDVIKSDDMGIKASCNTINKRHIITV